MGKHKKKKHTHVKKSWISDVPVGVCIFFVVVGLLIGNVFVIGVWHWGSMIERAEAIPLSASFESYRICTSPKGSVNEIEIRFQDHEKLYMDGACFDAEVRAALDALAGGERVELLLHLHSDYIWEMKSGDATVLSFEDAKDGVLAENIGYTVLLGFFGYLIAILGAVSLIMQWKEREKRKLTIKKQNAG